jgi:hypothetical protein
MKDNCCGLAVALNVAKPMEIFGEPTKTIAAAADEKKTFRSVNFLSMIVSMSRPQLKNNQI